MKISPEPIVVTGMGLLSPLGDSVSLLWQRLLAGESAVCNWPDLQEEGYRVSKACRLENFAAPPAPARPDAGFHCGPGSNPAGGTAHAPRNWRFYREHPGREPGF